jgi:PAS domain S-box-containing protein
VLGYEPAEIVGRLMLDFIADSEKAAVSERFVTQMTGSEQFSAFNSTLLPKDNAPVDVLMHNNVVTFRGQQASIGVIIDISEHKQEEKRIREEEDKFRSLAEQNVAGIVIVRDDATIGYCNGYFAHMIGYAPDEVVGRPLLDFVPETEQPSSLEICVRHSLRPAIRCRSPRRHPSAAAWCSCHR